MRNLLICLCIAAITLGLYWRVHGFEFVNYDDEGYVTENSHVLQGLTWKTFDYAFRSTDLANYHPLTWLSFELDVSMFGARPGPMHLENVLIHAANAALLFLLLMRATGDLRPALFCALIFAVHPAHVESVAWIAERKDVLSGFFFLLALLAYLNFVRTAGGGLKYTAYAAMALLLILGLLAKPMIVCFPFVLLLLDYWPLRRTIGIAGNQHQVRWKHLLVEKIPLLGLVIAASIVTYLAQHSGGAMVEFGSLPMTERIANSALSYLRYLGKFFWPTDLSIFYPRINNLPVLSVWPSLAAIVAISAGCWWFRRRAPFLIVGWLFFLGTLVPVIGIVQVGWQSIANRYLYLPMIGLAIMVAWSAEALFRVVKSSTGIRNLITAAQLAILASLSAGTIHQLQYWQDTRALFNHALAIDPQNAIAHIQLGYLDARLGNLDDAKHHYQESIRIDPTYFVSDFDLANLLLQTHHPQQAVTYYQIAANNRPGVAKVENNWGIALLQLNRPGEAFEHFRAAERIDPDLADAHFNLGQLFLRAGQLDSAEAEFRATLNLVPDHAGALKGLLAVRTERAGARG